MGLVRQVLDAVGIQQVEAAGWEADDLIATAADAIVAKGHQVIIVTGDRDSYQLVRDPHVRVLYNKRGVSDYSLYDEAGIQEKTGVTPELYPQYAALRGDPSDNLPGVPGVGEKTAAKLITQYGGLDGIFANTDQQTPKLRDNLAANEERARKNFELMLLRHDAPIDTVDFDALEIAPKPAEVKRLFEFLEFRTLGDRLAEALGSTSGIEPSTPRDELHAEVTTIESAAEAATLLIGSAVLDLAGVWAGSAAAARSPVSPWSPTRRCRARPGFPATCWLIRRWPPRSAATRTCGRTTSKMSCVLCSRSASTCVGCGSTQRSPRT